MSLTEEIILWLVFAIIMGWVIVDAILFRLKQRLKDLDKDISKALEEDDKEWF